MGVGIGERGIGYHGDMDNKGVSMEEARKNNVVCIRETNI